MTNVYFSAKVWRILFFVGVVLLNAMVPFRQGALKAGGWQQFGWSGGVVAIGAFLLYSLWQLRLHRQAKQATTTAAIEDVSSEVPHDVDEASKETPTAFVPPSRHKALAHTKKAQKKKKKKKRKKR